jgi:hypothetical protein
MWTAKSANPFARTGRSGPISSTSGGSVGND